MDSATIIRLLQPFARLSGPQTRNTLMYIDILLRWNARINLTAVRGEQEIVTRHFGESFFAASRLLAGNSRLEVIDVGSGAGFPGLPIAIFAAEAQVTLIESNTRKAAFLNEVISALELTNARVFCGRAQDYPEQAELVTMRAVEKFEESLPVALRLVRDRGRVGLMVGTSQLSKLAILSLGFIWEEAQLIPNSKSRVLAVGIKQVKVD